MNRSGHRSTAIRSPPRPTSTKAFARSVGAGRVEAIHPAPTAKLATAEVVVALREACGSSIRRLAKSTRMLRTASAQRPRRNTQTTMASRVSTVCPSPDARGPAACDRPTRSIQTTTASGTTAPNAVYTPAFRYISFRSGCMSEILALLECAALLRPSNTALDAPVRECTGSARLQLCQDGRSEAPVSFICGPRYPRGFRSRLLGSPLRRL